MENNKTFLVRKVTRNVIIFTGVIVLVFNFILLFYIGANLNGDYAKDVEEHLARKTDEVDEIIKNSIDDMSYIMTNQYISLNIAREFNNMYDSHEFIRNSLHITDGFKENGKKITIYTDNDTIYENSVFKNIERLRENKLYKQIVSADRTEAIYDDNGAEICIYRNFSESNQINICEVTIEKRIIYNTIKKNNGDKIFFFLNDYKICGEPGKYNISDSKEIQSGQKIVCGVSMRHWNIDFLKIIVINFIIIALCLGVIYLCIKLILKRSFAHLNSFLEALEQDNDEMLFTMMKEENKSDDIGIIKRKIVEILEKNRLLAVKFTKIEEEKHKSDVLLMQMKINPHLIYNSLSVVKWNLLRNDDYETADIIDSLIRYYRKALNFGKDVVTIEDEINMLKEYLEVMSSLRKNNYRLDVDIPQEILEEKILKMLLQPVVENSVLHAFGSRNSNAVISVSASRCCERLEIVISDNGYGMDEDTLRAFNTQGEISSHYGLSNIASRIKLYYGEDCRIEIISEEGMGTTVIYHIRRIM